MADEFTTPTERPRDAETSGALGHQPEVTGMSSEDSTSRANSWTAQNVIELVERREAEALEAESRMRPWLVDICRDYRRALSALDADPYFPARNGARLAPCPICGERTAVLSRGDLGAGPSVQIYCDNPECCAREIDITVRRGTLDEPIGWKETAPPPEPVKRTENKRPNQQLWRRMWRVRHRGLLLCNLCGLSENETSIQIDHIVELRDGGEDADWNTQPLCVECHRRKTSARSRR